MAAESVSTGGFFQLAGQTFVTTPENKVNHAHDLALRRVYVDLRGAVSEDISWRVHTNFAGNPALLDATLEWVLHPGFVLTAGKFKPPTGLERLLSASRAPFIEGSFVTVLQPSRDVGVQAGGEVARGALEYQAGVFNGANDNQDSFADTDGGKDVYARVFARPFAGSAGPLNGFGAGLSVSYGRRDGGTPGPVTTPGRQNLRPYADTTVLDGPLYRISPQASWQGGPVWLLTEYTRTVQGVSSGATRADVANAAWAVTGSWMLTGETNDARRGPVVTRSVGGQSGSGIGALELLLRAQGLILDESLAGGFGPADQADGVQSALSTGAALGWHLNRSVRLFTSFDRTIFKNARSALADRVTENVISFSLNASL